MLQAHRNDLHVSRLAKFVKSAFEPAVRYIPYANNPRLHSAADVERIAASILKWGWTNPALVDEQGVLIAGHGRVAAAAKLGLMVPIPVIVARGWGEEEKQAYRLADNELAARGSWDPDLLRSELRDLKFSGFNLDAIISDHAPLDLSRLKRGQPHRNFAV